MEFTCQETQSLQCSFKREIIARDRVMVHTQTFHFNFFPQELNYKAIENKNAPGGRRQNKLKSNIINIALGSKMKFHKTVQRISTLIHTYKKIRREITHEILFSRVMLFLPQ